jgi:hypothetical protein
LRSPPGERPTRSPRPTSSPSSSVSPASKSRMSPLAVILPLPPFFSNFPSVANHVSCVTLPSSAWSASARDVAGPNGSPQTAGTVFCVLSVVRGAASLFMPALSDAMYREEDAEKVATWGSYGYSTMIVFGTLALLTLSRPPFSQKSPACSWSIGLHLSSRWCRTAGVAGEEVSGEDGLKLLRKLTVSLAVWLSLSTIQRVEERADKARRACCENERLQRQLVFLLPLLPSLLLPNSFWRRC